MLDARRPRRPSTPRGASTRRRCPPARACCTRQDHELHRRPGCGSLGVAPRRSFSAVRRARSRCSSGRARAERVRISAGESEWTRARSPDRLSRAMNDGQLRRQPAREGLAPVDAARKRVHEDALVGERLLGGAVGVVEFAACAVHATPGGWPAIRPDAAGAPGWRPTACIGALAAMMGRWWARTRLTGRRGIHKSQKNSENCQPGTRPRRGLALCNCWRKCMRRWQCSCVAVRPECRGRSRVRVPALTPSSRRSPSSRRR